ncbi:MAG: PSD1 and planctomycete cytochrome C domain-containing protein [Phycisphaeraceae bacterium]
MSHRLFLLVAFLARPAFAAEQPLDFSRDVLPILSDKCFVCHGPDTQKKDLLRLDSFEAATRLLDGDTRAIDPKDPAKSEILVRIHSKDDPMPPKKAEKKLTDAERAVLDRWVRQGGKYERHWAFVAPRKPTLPAVGSGEKNPTDAFVLARLKEKNVPFAPEADRSTLARRAALTLTGLPPELSQLKAFLDDKRPDAYEHYIDTLLTSPRFGEHQARYWLDAVRYGDTHGLHLDNKRGIFPYRDWVVRAFNENLPLDVFLTWQLAGDMLPDPTLAQLVATGFVRMNPTTAEGGAIPAEFQAKNNFDRVETIGTVLLGMTFICSRCHTHKYDPIQQTEYYELLAFFNNTAESPLDGNKYDYAPVIKAPATQQAWTQWLEVEAARDKLLKSASTAALVQAKNWASLDSDGKLKLLADAKGPLKNFAQHADAVALAQKIAELEKDFTTTLVAKELPSPRETRLLKRGEYDLPDGEPLKPAVPAIMGALPKAAPTNRLGLSQWLTARDHPLTARVLVNQLWLRAFGDGLVRTPEDFGLQGQQPTHPLLLDWLAMELHDSKWDQKHMLRLMVTSRTFKQSAARRQDITDPENRLLARGPGYRLDAEVIRDLGLWAAGMLEPDMGGDGIKPYQPAGLWEALMHPASNTKSYIQDHGAKLYRRSLYVYWKRTSPHPMLTLFDAPSREASCIRRSRTSTPVQSLGLLNETQRVEMARKLAERLVREADSDAKRVELLFTLLASRAPTELESRVCASLIKSARERFTNAKNDATALLAIGEAKRDEKLDAIEVAAWTQVTTTILASDVAILLY